MHFDCIFEFCWFIVVCVLLVCLLVVCVWGLLFKFCSYCYFLVLVGFVFEAGDFGGLGLV